MFGEAVGRHPPSRSHGAYLDVSLWFDLWRMMMVHSPVYVRPLEVAFLGHGAWSSGRRLGCMQIYSLVLGGPGIVLIDHGTWWSGIGLGFLITCLLGSSIPCHNRVDLTFPFLRISYPCWNGQVYSNVVAHTLYFFWHGWVCMWRKLMEILLGTWRLSF